MATCHSIAHARLMGAISHKRYQKFVSHEPSRATAPEGFLFSEARFVQRSEMKTGDPDPGARASDRARPKARGLPEGTARATAVHRWQGEPIRVRFGGAPYSRAPRQYSFCNLVCRVCGLMNAGGEDVGYFAPGKAGSNPASDVTYRGSGLARAVASRAPVLPQGRACVDITESRLRPFPSVMAVVKMPVTSVERRESGGRTVRFRPAAMS